MNRYRLAVASIIALAAIAIALPLRAQKDAAPPVQKWEYKHFHPSFGTVGGALIEKANELGADGWEMVTCVPATMDCFFKRPRQ